MGLINEPAPDDFMHAPDGGFEVVNLAQTDFGLMRGVFDKLVPLLNAVIEEREGIKSAISVTDDAIEYMRVLFEGNIRMAKVLLSNTILYADDVEHLQFPIVFDRRLVEATYEDIQRSLRWDPDSEDCKEPGKLNGFSWVW